MKQRGVVTKYDTGRRFGFIRLNQGRGHHDDLFFHRDDIATGAAELQVGSSVSFNVVKAEKGPKAVDIIVRSPPVNPKSFFAGGVVFITTVVVVALTLYFPQFTALGAYLLGINLALFIVLGYDKGISGSTTSRVPELILYLGAAFGGAFGILLAMKTFRHKIRKSGFQFIIAAILIAQLVLLRVIFEKVSLAIIWR